MPQFSKKTLFLPPLLAAELELLPPEVEGRESELPDCIPRSSQKVPKNAKIRILVEE